MNIALVSSHAYVLPSDLFVQGFRNSFLDFRWGRQSVSLCFTNTPASEGAHEARGRRRHTALDTI